MTLDATLDIAGLTDLPRYDDDVKAQDVSPAPFSKVFIARDFDPAGHPDFLKDWDSLAQSMPVKMPFQTAHWNKTWWSHFRRRTSFLKDELHLVCAMRDDKLVGIIPLFKTTVGLPGLPVFRYLKLLGADSNLTEWRSPICRAKPPATQTTPPPR